jgi:hypothetical protein
LAVAKNDIKNNAIIDNTGEAMVAQRRLVVAINCEELSENFENGMKMKEQTVRERVFWDLNMQWLTTLTHREHREKNQICIINILLERTLKLIYSILLHKNLLFIIVFSHVSVSLLSLSRLSFIFRFEEDFCRHAVMNVFRF